MSHADGNSTDISGADQPITICSRGRFASNPASDQWLVSKWDTNGQRQFGLKAESSNQSIWFILSNDGATQYAAKSQANVWVVGQYYSVCGVYDDTNSMVYINGQLASNGSDNPLAYSAGIFNGTSPFFLGSRNGGNESFDGHIYDAILLNRALSASEVLQYHQAGIRGNNT
jgi:hypothetical protein